MINIKDYEIYEADEDEGKISLGNMDGVAIAEWTNTNANGNVRIYSWPVGSTDIHLLQEHTIGHTFKQFLEEVRKYLD